MTATCRSIGGDRFGIWCPYEVKDFVKRLPGARWDPDLRCWYVHTQFRADAEEFCAAVNEGRNPTAPPPRSPKSAPTMDTRAAFAVLLKAAGPLAEKLYKSSAKVLHPDLGGTEQLMKALTAAWNECK